MSEDAEQDGVLRAAAANEPAGTGAHLDDAVLLSYRRKTLSTEDEERADVHLATCTECRELLRAMDPVLPDLSASRARAALAPRRKFPVWMAAAAGVLLVAGTLALLEVSKPPLGLYNIEGPHGAVAAFRANHPETELGEWDANSTVRFVIRPDVATVERPEIEVFIAPTADKSAKAETDKFSVEWTVSGAAELSAKASALFPKPGGYTLWIDVVGAANEARREYHCVYIE